VNNNCSTGSTALYLARQLISGGNADCIMAVGFDKMARGSLQSAFSDRTNPLDQHMNVMSEHRGITSAPFAPQMFGNAGVEHMEKYGTTPEQIAMIAMKNHKHSGLNPYSQFQDEYTLDQIMKSQMVNLFSFISLLYVLILLFFLLLLDSCASDKASMLSHI
jgi:acetyl-CoA acetyltransferase